MQITSDMLLKAITINLYEFLIKELPRHPSALAAVASPSPLSDPTHVSEPTERRWHPRLTPYRILALCVPAFFGTTKAIVTQRGDIDEPITLEWIAGVVVFLVLFSLGCCECAPSRPRQLAWLFDTDCTDAVWRVVPLSRLRYDSDEEYEGDGIITAYRLLVSATVAGIGMVKAILAYRGFATGVTWVEWVLGVVITSLLYILGLYESNTAGLWPAFFKTDRSYELYYCRILFAKGSIITLTLYFLVSWPLSAVSGTAGLLAYRRGKKDLAETIKGLLSTAQNTPFALVAVDLVTYLVPQGVWTSAPAMLVARVYHSVLSPHDAMRHALVLLLAAAAAALGWSALLAVALVWPLFAEPSVAWISLELLMLYSLPCFFVSTSILGGLLRAMGAALRGLVVAARSA